MSQLEPVNDPELNQLEQSLQTIQLKPTASQCDQYLFTCGQAAGRIEMKKRLRVSSAFTGLFAMTTVCLLFLQVSHPIPETIKPEHVPSPILVEKHQRYPARPDILRVSSRNLDLLVFNKPNPQPTKTTNRTLPEQPQIMTSRSWPELFDN